MVKFTVDTTASQKLADAMAKIPEHSERLINEVLKSKGSKEVIESIIGFMPVSNRNKPHAKESNPLKAKMFNLGFDIVARGGAAKNKGSFGYLVFPNEGRGKHNPHAQEFFERGLNDRRDAIMDAMIEALVKASNDALAGK